jgi:anaerobic magnesium-protoporphyrin IX monomethyl ester cyclase
MVFYIVVKKSICLVAPPSPFENIPDLDIPLGLAYLAAYLKSKGYADITLVDFNTLAYDYYKDDAYLKEIPLDKDVYGIACATAQFYWFCRIADFIKGRKGSSFVIGGGPHPTVRPDECLARSKADAVVLGEGEEALYGLLENKNGIAGIHTRSRKGSTAVISNLDALPFSDRSLLPPSRYKRTLGGQKAFHVVSGRSCPFDCSFCSKRAVGRTLRLRSTGHFVREIDELIARYGVTRYVIYDDVFAVDAQRAVSIARALGARGVTWRCFSRADMLDDELLAAFRENGLSSITIGIETFSPKMLSVYGKGVTAQENEAVLRLCRKHGIPTRCSLIYGGPYETRDTLRETIDGIGRAQPDEWNVSTFIPVPGSALGDNPGKYGITVHEDPYYQGYHRAGASGMGEITADISTMSPEEYETNRKWFIGELERVSPRRMIQDTMQDLCLP